MASGLFPEQDGGRIASLSFTLTFSLHYHYTLVMSVALENTSSGSQGAATSHHTDHLSAADASQNPYAAPASTISVIVKYWTRLRGLLPDGVLQKDFGERVLIETPARPTLWRADTCVHLRVWANWALPLLGDSGLFTRTSTRLSLQVLCSQALA